MEEPAKPEPPIVGTAGVTAAAAYDATIASTAATSTIPYTIKQIKTSAELQASLSSLTSLLQDCVNPDPATSSIGFLAPLSDPEADSYWQSLSANLQAEPLTFYLFVLLAPATSEDGSPASPSLSSSRVLASVQIFTIAKRTHAHRAEVAKLLVRPGSRRLGLGRRLMAHVEAFARNELGRELLTLDTASRTPAREFYARLGWLEWGTCPEYADYADGKRGDATFFVKFLR